MASAILRGFSAHQIITHLMRRYPQHADKILAAQTAGYTAQQILNKIGDEPDTSEKYLTDHEKVQKRDDSQKRQALIQAIGVLGAGGLLAGGVYAYATRNRAIHPTAILPALSKQKQLPAPQSPIGLPYLQGGHGPKAPVIPLNQQPSPSAQPSQPSSGVTRSTPTQTNKIPRDPLQNVELARNLREDDRMANIIKNNEYDPLTTSLILRSVLPKNKIALFDKIEGGLEQVVKDFSDYLKSQKKKEEIQPISSPDMQNMQPEREQKTQNISPIQVQQQAPQGPMRSTETSNIQPLRPEIEPEPETQGNLAILPKGQIGELESVKNGIAKINVSGNILNKKLSEIEPEPQGVERAVREVINSIPEGMKSTALQSMVHVPLEGLNLLLTQFYDGKWAWYLDVPEDIYKNIALGTYEPKGQAKTGIGEYKPGVADSRGAGYHEQIKMNPKYSKENKGKTWGYATNEYALLHNIQNILNKISKERYDESGNLITPKSRKKKDEI